MQWLKGALCGMGIACLLGGCTASLPEPQELPEAPPEPPTRIVFVNKSINSYFYIIVNASLEREAKARGWRYELVVSDYDSVKQNNQLINLLADAPDAIVINPINSETLAYGIETAGVQDIPICVVDTPATDGKSALTVAFDNYLAGQLAAEEIVRRLTEKYGSPRGVVYEATNNPDSSAWALRREGFREVLSRYPAIQHIDEPGYSDPDTICRNLARTLETTVVDAVHCSSDHQSRGLVKALQDAGQWEPVGQEGHVILVTIDGDPSSMDGIRAGYYDATIAQDAIQYGTLTVRMLDEYILPGLPIPTGEVAGEGNQGYTVSESERGYQVTIPPYVIDSGNVSDPAHWGNVAVDQWSFQYK